MYTLTLTRDERRAFDFVDGRYANGTDMIRVLIFDTHFDENAEWDGNYDITFTIPEHAAWMIREMAKEDNYLWPNFAPELAAKMQTFVDSIV
jgi:hypothetical protein